MCGFVAIINERGSPDMTMLAQMAAALEHRGPDGEGTYNEQGVGFHHKRLAVIDVAGGKQPMTAHGVAVVCNGEIYNYIELRTELIKLGHRFETESDTEVLLHAYLQWGNQAVARLNGMFAFVIHDSRTNTILAARDAFGIKPLYRARIGGATIYASEIKAILEHPGFTRELDRTGLEDYLSLQFVLGERTMFSGVEKLLPAHFEQLNRDSQKTVITRYWDPDYTSDSSIDFDGAVRQTGDLLHASVARQMRSDVPVGAYLSGGLDSSFVAAAAISHTDKGFDTFSGAFHEGPEFDESQHAKAVAEHIGARMHQIYPTDNDFIDNLQSLIYHMDEPAAGPGLFPQFMVSSAAREKVTVCLGGQGGDEIFVGYARYLIGALEEALLGSIKGGGSEDSLTLANVEHCLGTLNNYMPLLQRVWGQGLDAPGHQRYFRVMNRLDASSALLAPETRNALAKSSVAQRFESVFERPTGASHLKKMLHFDMTVNLPTLLQVEDRASMASSLESRVPLLDTHVVQSVARIPDRVLLAGGFSKAVLRQVASPILPDSVVNRTDKMGFPVPLQRWAKGSAREFIRDILLSQRARERGIFDNAELERLIDHEFEFGRSLWGALQVELWHRTFIDGGAKVASFKCRAASKQCVPSEPETETESH